MMRVVIFIVCLLFSFKMIAQQSTKLVRQKTNFFYTQVNLNVGRQSSMYLEPWQWKAGSPANQVTFQFAKKAQRLIQKGFNKSVAPVSYRLKWSTVFEENQVNGESALGLALVVRDAWVKFGTKWDRTHFWIGNRSVPYGHNPKIDPASSFQTSVINMDFGFGQDFGVYIKTPISNSVDLDFSLTSGGAFNQAMVSINNVFMNNKQGEFNRVQMANFGYNGTWLAMTRLGSPVYRKNEFGWIGGIGKIEQRGIDQAPVHVYRTGLDWIYKFREVLKVDVIATVGYNNEANNEPAFWVHNMQSSVDLFLAGKIIVSNSFALNHRMNHTQRSFMSSFGYAISPHCRLRLNYLNTSNSESRVAQPKQGVFLQFVGGFGARP